MNPTSAGISTQALAEFRMTRGKWGPKDGQPGTLLSRVPFSYLRWMVNEGHEHKAWAAAEIARRGLSLPTIELSGHAIDRASLRCRKIWHETALGPDEGLHAWLMRMAGAALKEGEDHEDKNADARLPGIVKRYAGIKWVFMDGEEFPVLKTVLRLTKPKVGAPEDREWESFADVDGEEKAPW